MGYRVIFSPSDSTELEQFALWFHQDWKLCSPDFHEGARQYVAGLPPDRKAVLRQELLRFLKKHADEPQSVLRRLWLKLGAQVWPRDLDVRSTLNAFAGMMRDGQ